MREHIHSIIYEDFVQAALKAEGRRAAAAAASAAGHEQLK
jgi:hypothetical protein